jgi:hypothetical protein
MRHDSIIKCSSSSEGFLLHQSGEHSLVVGVHELVHGLGNSSNTSCAKVEVGVPR